MFSCSRSLISADCWIKMSTDRCFTQMFADSYNSADRYSFQKQRKRNISSAETISIICFEKEGEFCLKMGAELSFWLGTRFPGSSIISMSDFGECFWPPYIIFSMPWKWYCKFNSSVIYEQDPNLLATYRKCCPNCYDTLTRANYLLTGSVTTS